MWREHATGVLKLYDALSRNATGDGPFQARTMQISGPLRRALSVEETGSGLGGTGAEADTRDRVTRVVGLAYIFLGMTVIPAVRDYFMASYKSDSLARRRALRLIRDVVPKLLDRATRGQAGCVSLSAFVEECVYGYLVEL